MNKTGSTGRFCKECDYWAGDMCVDEIEYIDADTKMPCCRYNLNAVLKPKAKTNDFDIGLIVDLAKLEIADKVLRNITLRVEDDKQEDVTRRLYLAIDEIDRLRQEVFDRLEDAGYEGLDHLTGVMVG